MYSPKLSTKGKYLVLPAFIHNHKIFPWSRSPFLANLRLHPVCNNWSPTHLQLHLTCNGITMRSHPNNKFAVLSWPGRTQFRRSQLLIICDGKTIRSVTHTLYVSTYILNFSTFTTAELKRCKATTPSPMMIWKVRFWQPQQYMH